MASLPNLVWLRAFECAARRHSFTAAAEELALTQAAVSHQVRSLEKTFGVALFIRRSRTLELTEIGHAYYPSIAQALSDIAYSTRGLLGPSEAKAVTLRAPISTSVLWIAPRLGAFRHANPNINIRLISAIWADSATEEDIDIDIRLGPRSWFGASAQLLSEEVMIPVCAPEDCASIKTIPDLLARELIHIHGYQDHWLRFFQMQGLETQALRQGLFVDTSLAAIELIMAGSGVAMIMKRYTQDHLMAGRLAQPLDIEIPMAQGHFLMPSKDDAAFSPETSQLRDWTIRLFTQTP